MWNTGLRGECFFYTKGKVGKHSFLWFYGNFLLLEGFLFGFCFYSWVAVNCILAALLISNQSDRVRIALHCWTDLSLARIRANQNTRYDPGALSWAALLSSDQSGRVRIALHCWIDLSLARIRANQNTRYDPGALSWAALVSSDQSGRVRIALHCWIDLSFSSDKSESKMIKDDQRWPWSLELSCIGELRSKWQS